MSTDLDFAPFISRTYGSHVWDTEFREFVDMNCACGTALWGHTDQDIMLAVQQAILDGISYGSTSSREDELQKLICACFPSVEEVCFFESQTDAIMASLRLARAFTGRDYILKMDGCYHGEIDSLMPVINNKGSAATIAEKTGISESSYSKTLHSTYNNIDQLARIFRTFGSEIAAVIIEPLPVHMGLIIPKEKFLEELVLIARQHGALVIFDETTTGFRLAAGGAQEYFKVNADLTVLGSSISSGLPIGVLGGKTKVMKSFRFCSDVFSSFKNCSNQLSLASAIAVINKIDQQPGIYGKMAKQMECIEDSVYRARDRFKIDIQVNRCGSMLSVFFNKREVNNEQDVAFCNKSNYRKFYDLMINNHIFVPSTMLQPWYICAAHSTTDVIKVARSIESSLEIIGADNCRQEPENS